MTREEASDWLDGPCPGGFGHEGSRSPGWKRQDCHECMVDALALKPVPTTGASMVTIMCQCGQLDLTEAELLRTPDGRWHRRKRCDTIER